MHRDLLKYTRGRPVYACGAPSRRSPPNIWQLLWSADIPDLLLNLYDHTAHTRQGRLLRQRTDECHSRLQKQILPITGWQLFVKLRWLFPCWLMLLFDLSADKYMVAATGWQITLCLNSFPGPQRNGADPLLPEKKKPMRLRKERGAFSFPGSNNTPRKKKQQLWYVLYSLLAIPCKGRSRGCAF